MQLNSILNHTFTSSGAFLRTNRVVEACDLMQTMEEMSYFPDSITYEVVVFILVAGEMDLQDR